MFRLPVLCALLLITGPWVTAQAADTPKCGTLLESTLLATYAREQLDANLQRLGLKARYGIKVFRVNYQSQKSPDRTRATAASGLVIMPELSATELPWISLQHGTVAGKNEAPSLRLGVGFYEASQGFVTAVMDYIGYGSSADELHPYLIAETYVPAGVDQLRAARTLAANQGLKLGPLFLRGYSEGGYATMAMQRALETDYSQEFTLTASAPAAGPYDLEVAALASLSRPVSSPLITAFLLLAYDEWLAPEIDLDAILIPDVPPIKSLYTNGASSSDIMKALPAETRKLIDGPFLDDFLSEKPQTAQARLIRRLLAEQSFTQGRWAPKTPTRLYPCRGDETVAVEATERALAHFKAIDADAPVSAIIAQSPDPSRPYSHGNCPLVYTSVAWFLELAKR